MFNFFNKISSDNRDVNKKISISLKIKILSFFALEKVKTPGKTPRFAPLQILCVISATLWLVEKILAYIAFFLR